MARLDSLRRLIVNADDFGRSTAINQAIIRAHQEGVLTTASLMVNGDAFPEAVQLARENPRLGVGLHLTLVCGRSTLSAAQIPGLTSRSGEFSDGAVGVGLRYFFERSLRPQLEREMAAQFEKFSQTGLVLDHVNGHLNLHLHPVVFQILIRNAVQWKVRRMRLTRDRLGINLAVARGRWACRLSHALIFGLLSAWARPKMELHQIRFAAPVFGLLQTGHVDEEYVTRILSRLPAGDSELYSHPCLEKFREEFDALISPKVRQLVAEKRIELIRYQDL